MQQEKTIRYTLHEDWRTKAIVPKAIEEKLEALLESAYAPYSNYPVSSVVLLDNGHTVVGTNQAYNAHWFPIFPFKLFGLLYL